MTVSPILPALARVTDRLGKGGEMSTKDCVALADCEHGMNCYCESCESWIEFFRDNSYPGPPQPRGLYLVSNESDDDPHR